MKRTKEITIIHYRRRRVIKSRPPTTDRCPVCGNESDLMTVTLAIRLTGVSRATFDRWMASHQVHGTRSAKGQLCICRHCLSEQVAHSLARLEADAAEMKP
ncbi:MAG: hypothetical protein HY314_03625 [Acidobacteria bacterium]|nr:hypothetical protein [Acidobacteriota bacterium]